MSFDDKLPDGRPVVATVLEEASNADWDAFARFVANPELVA